jgi:hypothetical protein
LYPDSEIPDEHAGRNVSPDEATNLQCLPMRLDVEGDLDAGEATLFLQ